MLTTRAPSLRSDLQTALSEPQDESEAGFSASERTILENVLKLSDIRVEDVMVPRADMEAVEASATLGQAIARFLEVGHSRLPVYEDNLDAVTGFIHIRDVLARITEPVKTAESSPGQNGVANPVKLVSPTLRTRLSKLQIVRDLLFVPPSMPITDLLQSMQATHIHMAVVIDEYGGTDGLVTIEDLLEAVVGDIEDEHDEDDAVMVRRIDESTWLANARIELVDLYQAIGSAFDAGDYIDEVDTLGGLIFAMAGRVPVRGEIVTGLEGWAFEITRADARMVHQVRIVRRDGDAEVPPRIEALPSPEAFAHERETMGQTVDAGPDPVSRAEDAVQDSPRAAMH